MVGSSLVWSGNNVYQTGVLINAEIRGGIVIKSSEYTVPIAIFLVFLGSCLLVSTVWSFKNDL